MQALVVAPLVLGFAPTTPVTRPGTSARVTTSPIMSEPACDRRALLSALFLGAAPAAANAMTIPGLNAPGLVPAKKQKYPYGEGFGGNTVNGDFDYVRDSKINHFWNDNGIVNSVPKVRGIITPKSPTLVGGPGGTTQDKLDRKLAGLE